MATKQELEDRLNGAENWYRSKRYYVQVLGLLLLGIALGRLGAPWIF